MDICELKNEISSDYNNIRIILEKIECNRISENKKEFRCAKNKYDSNSTRVVVKKNEGLTSKIYDIETTKGDIFTIIMKIKNCSLRDSLKICCNALGLNFNNMNNYKPKKRKKAFGGFYSSNKNNQIENMTLLKIYDDNELNLFINKGNILFFEDGIHYDIQTIFNIMYDDKTNRIVVPWRDFLGRIVGFMGRYNKSAEYCLENNISKWLPIKNYSFFKSQVVYGFYENYNYILEAGRVYVGESEKFVLQLASFGIRNSVAIGSHEVCEVHKRLLLSLGVEIVLCFDNDISDKINIKQCKKFRNKSSLLQAKVGYVITDDILNDKESPSDRGLDIFKKCVDENNILWIIGGDDFVN